MAVWSLNSRPTPNSEVISVPFFSSSFLLLRNIQTPRKVERIGQWRTKSTIINILLCVCCIHTCVRSHCFGHTMWRQVAGFMPSYPKYFSRHLLKQGPSLTCRNSITIAKIFHTDPMISSPYSYSLYCLTNVFSTCFYVCLCLLCICLYKRKVNLIKIHMLQFGSYTSLVSFSVE